MALNISFFFLNQVLGNWILEFFSSKSLLLVRIKLSDYEQLAQCWAFYSMIKWGHVRRLPEKSNFYLVQKNWVRFELKRREQREDKKVTERLKNTEVCLWMKSKILSDLEEGKAQEVSVLNYTWKVVIFWWRSYRGTCSHDLLHSKILLLTRSLSWIWRFHLTLQAACGFCWD